MLAELVIPAGVAVDQMTAVAEGASIYAESVDWGGMQHHRKQSREEMSAMAVIGTIPASSPIAIKALDRVGGKAVPIYLVEENDPLPHRGQITLVAGQTIHAGREDALVFTLWEGGIKDPIKDNRYIGSYRISGTSISEGTVKAGMEIVCDYEMSDSGALRLGVSIPALGVSLLEVNFYSPQDGQTALDDHPRLLSQVASLEQRLSMIKGRLPNTPEVTALTEKLAGIRDIAEHSEEPDSLLKANNDLLECLRTLSHIRQAHRRDIRLLDLDQVTGRFEHFKASATEIEISAFNTCREAALRVDKNNNADELRRILSELLSIERPDNVQGTEHMLDQVNVVKK